MIWSTPQPIFDKLNDEFGFTVDLCADPENAKCESWIQRNDSLATDWSGIGWLNPPYGREIGKYLEKASYCKSLVVALVPTRTNAPWWHDYVMRAGEIRFIRKKLSFHPHKGVPFTGHAIVVFYRQGAKVPIVSSWDQP